MGPRPPVRLGAGGHSQVEGCRWGGPLGVPEATRLNCLHPRSGWSVRGRGSREWVRPGHGSGGWSQGPRSPRAGPHGGWRRSHAHQPARQRLQGGGHSLGPGGQGAALRACPCQTLGPGMDHPRLPPMSGETESQKGERLVRGGSASTLNRRRCGEGLGCRRQGSRWLLLSLQRSRAAAQTQNLSFQRRQNSSTTTSEAEGARPELGTPRAWGGQGRPACGQDASARPRCPPGCPQPHPRPPHAGPTACGEPGRHQRAPRTRRRAGPGPPGPARPQPGAHRRTPRPGGPMSPGLRVWGGNGLLVATLRVPSGCCGLSAPWAPD
nr:serine/arginine repetitive matrix protein 3-like [Equus asinus]